MSLSKDVSTEDDVKASLALIVWNTQAPPSSPPATTQASQEGKVSLMTLPAELRLLIYSHLLISHEKILLRSPCLYKSGLCPAILRTCKQIHAEAISVLYGQNNFITDPYPCCPYPCCQEFLTENRSYSNAPLIKRIKIHIFPYPMKDNSFPWAEEYWLQKLDAIRKEFTGLRYLALTFGFKTCESYDVYEDLGESVKIARRLAEFQGLKRLQLKGLYAKNWPAYLKGKGVPVSVSDTTIEYPFLPFPETAAFVRELRQTQADDLERKRGVLHARTEHLWP